MRRQVAVLYKMTFGWMQMNSDLLSVKRITPADLSVAGFAGNMTLPGAPERGVCFMRAAGDHSALADELLERQDSLLLEMYADLDGDGTPDGEYTQENLPENTGAPSETAANAGETKGGDH